MQLQYSTTLLTQTPKGNEQFKLAGVQVSRVAVEL